ncbi:MAG TPA: YbaB/EbfC family nucleoid-associated protein [Acidimicrobiales bacterium]|nr:YbaB/EbfC family nucleoid-associated protein [Acidimicrobiales bacterium]
MSHDDEFDDDAIDAEVEGEGGGLGGFDLGGLLAQAQSMQQQLADAQARVAAQSVEGQAGGGVVRVTMTGGFEFTDVRIDPAAVDPADVEMLQDLVLAAVRDAVGRVNALNQEAMQTMGGGLGGAFGGLLP